MSFWVHPERMGELEEAFAGQIVPILKKRGLTSEELIDHTLEEIGRFAVDVTQDDDQTIVVLKKG